MNTFTVEGWIYPTSLANVYWIVGDMSATGTTNVLSVRIGQNGDLVLYWFDGAIKECFSPNGVIRANQWNWFAIVVNSNAISMYVNSTTAASLTGTTTLTNRTQTTNFSVSQYNNSVTFLGYIGSLRWSNGIARTVSSIPTAPYTSDANTSLLLNFTNAGIVDGTMKNNLETVGNAQISTAVVKYGTGSMYFDGTSDLIFIPYSAIIDLKSTYTIEAWIYPLTTSGFRPIFNIQTNNVGTFGMLQLAQNGSQVLVETRPTTGGAVTSISGGTLITNTWFHVAASVSGGSARLFLNGTQVGSTTTFSDYSFTPVGAGVGANANGYLSSTEVFNGYIDDLRVTRGIARYTANFTPPTVALPRQ